MADICDLMGQLSSLEGDSEVGFEGSIALMAGPRDQRKAAMVYQNKKFVVSKSPIGLIITEVTDEETAFQIAFKPADRWGAHDDYLSVMISEIQGACPDYVNTEIVAKYHPDELRIR